MRMEILYNYYLEADLTHKERGGRADTALSQSGICSKQNMIMFSQCITGFGAKIQISLK